MDSKLQLEKHNCLKDKNSNALSEQFFIEKGDQYLNSSNFQQLKIRNNNYLSRK